MYSDPTLIRKHRVNLSFNDREQALVRALCEYTGDEPAAFIRSLVLERAEEVLVHGSQSGSSGAGMREANEMRLAA
jgi:uncharacterized protein (DUF1778 family)